MRKNLTLLSILGILVAFSPPPSYAQSIEVAAFSKDGELWTVDNSVSTFNATATTTLANLKVWANGSQSTAVNASNENQTDNLLLTINATDIWTNGAQSNTVVLKSAGGGVSYRAGVSSKIWANGAGSSAIWSESGGGSLSVSAAEGETMEIWTAQPGVNTIRTDSPDVELRNLKARASGNRAGALWVETASPSAISVAIHNSQLGAGRPVFSRYLNTVHVTSAGDSENIDIEINGSKIWTGGTNSSAIAANPGTGSVAVDVKGSEIWANQSASSAIFATSANTDSGANAVVVKVESSRVWSGQDAGRDSNVIRAQTTGAGKIYVEIRNSTVFEDSRLSFQARSAAVMMNSTGQGGIGFVASGSNLWSGGINSKTIRAESAEAIRQDTTLIIANGSNVWANGGTDGSAIFVNSHRFIGITISGSRVWSVGESRATAESNSHHSAGSWTGARAEWVVANGSKVWANGAGTGAIYMNSQRAPGSGIVISGGSEVWTEGDSAYSIYGNASERNQYIEVHSHSRVWANGAGSTAIYANSAGGRIDDFARVIVNGSSRVFTIDEMSNAIAVDTEAFANIVVHDGSRVWTNGAKSNAIFMGFGIGDSHMRVSERSQVYTTGADSNAIAITDGFAGARSYVYVDGGSRVFSNGARSAAININAYNRDAIANISGGAGVYATGVDSVAIMLAERARSFGRGEMELYISGGANVSADGQNSTAVFLRSGRAAYYKTIMKVFEDGLVCSGVIDAGRNCLTNRGAAGAAAVRIRDDGNADDDPADYHSILENAGTIVGDVKLSDYHDRITNKDTGVITIVGSLDTGTGEDTFRNDGIINGTGAPINFGGGDDYFINNGTMVIGGEGFAGLEKITFGENSTLVITADPVEMAGRSLINVQDEISEADIEGFSARFANPGRLSGEFLLFREEILVDSEDERQAIFNIVDEGLERNASARMDEIGNIFITLSNLRPYDYLRNYDAMIQSAYYADNAFSEKLRGGCYGGGDETETQNLRGGCLWAAADGRFTRHTATSEYSEDAHVFTGGFTVPAGKSAVSVAAGYETSDFDAGTDTSAGGERFMAGISVASEFWSGIITDVRTQFARATWESAALRGGSLINDNGKHGAKTDVATWSAAVGGEMPIFPGGVFMVVPRVEAGVTKVSADGFRETALEDSALTVEGAGKTYLVISPSVTAYVPAGETVNIWMSLGADAHITDPETQWSARTSGGDLFKVTGSLERIMVNYGAGAEFVLPYKGFSARIDYDGGVTPGLDTLTQVFSARVGLAF